MTAAIAPLESLDLVGYDEVAHHSGIRATEALAVLRRVDDHDRALFVRHRDKSNTRCREDIERIHVGRTDDAEYLCHPVRSHGLFQGFRRSHALSRDFAHKEEISCPCR